MDNKQQLQQLCHRLGGEHILTAILYSVNSGVSYENNYEQSIAMRCHNGMLTTIITLIMAAAITAGVCVSCYFKGYQLGYMAGEDKTEFAHRLEVEQEKMSVRATENMVASMKELATMSYRSDAKAKKKPE